MRKSENEKEIGTCSVKKSYCTKKSWCSDNGMLHVFSVFPRSNRWKSTASAWDQDDHCSANSRGGQHQVKVFYGFGNDMQCQHQHHHHLDCQAVRGEDASNIKGGRCGPADQEGPPPLFKPPGSQTALVLYSLKIINKTRDRNHCQVNNVLITADSARPGCWKGEDLGGAEGWRGRDPHPEALWREVQQNLMQMTKHQHLFP